MARTVGAVGSDLAAIRSLVRTTQEIRRYEPSGNAAAWAAAERRLRAPKG